MHVHRQAGLIGDRPKRIPARVVERCHVKRCQHLKTFGDTALRNPLYFRRGERPAVLPPNQDYLNETGAVSRHVIVGRQIDGCALRRRLPPEVDEPRNENEEIEPALQDLTTWR